MKSIRTRLAVYFVIVILITIVVLEVFLVGIVRQNYYKNLEDSLISQIKISSDIYARYFSESTIYENVLNNVDTFWRQTNAQVQIIDLSGKVLMDSMGVMPAAGTPTDDVKAAMAGRAGKWVGKVDYDTGEVMSVSYPLRTEEKIVGVLRFVSSLRNVNSDIKAITDIFIIVGAAVALVSTVFSLLLANSIVKPLREVTITAEKMAAGNYSAQGKKRREDEVGKLTDTLNFMAREIQKKEQLKNDFISSVSHELRTPLTAIKGWAITLKNGSLEKAEEISDGLDIIEKESDRLTGMVEELLDFSRFVSGKVTIKKETLSIKELLEHVRREMAPRAERDGIAFQAACGEELPEILSDGNRLKQIFINLLDNAFRFTPSGGTVALTAGLEDRKAVFRIRDTGCGISNEELPLIKEKFYKGKNSNSRNGLGLSICDELAGLLGGTLRIESELEKGTEVILTLPLAEGDAI